MPLFNRTIEPLSRGWSIFATGGSMNVLNATSGTNVTPTNGTIYWAALPIWMNATLTGLTVTIGTAGGNGTTDRLIVALYDKNGNLVANSALAGTLVTTSTGVKFKVAFTAAYSVVGPDQYFAAVQFNSNTPRFLSFSNANEGFVTGSVAGTFGTLPSITPGSTYSTSVGPFANTY